MNQRGITLWIGEERTSAPIHATDRPETLGRQDVVLVTLKSSVLTADVGVADASLAARRATQPIGTPDEIIEKIRTLQHALSLEMVVIHFFYGGMPRAKAEKSLRLFAEKVLPAVQAMPTPINPASLGQPES